jgi:hypothetical protein
MGGRRGPKKYAKVTDLDPPGHIEKEKEHRQNDFGISGIRNSLNLNSNSLAAGIGIDSDQDDDIDVEERKRLNTIY